MIRIRNVRRTFGSAYSTERAVNYPSHFGTGRTTIFRSARFFRGSPRPRRIRPGNYKIESIRKDFKGFAFELARALRTRRPTSKRQKEGVTISFEDERNAGNKKERARHELNKNIGSARYSDWTYAVSAIEERRGEDSRRQGKAFNMKLVSSSNILHEKAETLLLDFPPAAAPRPWICIRTRLHGIAACCVFPVEGARKKLIIFERFLRRTRVSAYPAAQSEPCRIFRPKSEILTNSFNF